MSSFSFSSSSLCKVFLSSYPSPTPVILPCPFGGVWFYVCDCMCVSVCLFDEQYVLMRVPANVWTGQRTTLAVILQVSFFMVFETVSYWPETRQAGYVGWTGSSSSLPASSPHTVIIITHHHALFLLIFAFLIKSMLMWVPKDWIWVLMLVR